MNNPLFLNCEKVTLLPIATNLINTEYYLCVKDFTFSIIPNSLQCIMNFLLVTTMKSYTTPVCTSGHLLLQTYFLLYLRLRTRNFFSSTFNFMKTCD